MLEVDIDKILPVTEARDNFNKIIDDVGGTDHMYVLTKNGKPSAVVVGVNHLEKLTGKTADELTSIVEKKADLPAGRHGETPVVEEVSKPTSNIAGGSKPPATDSFATGQSIQPGASGQSNATVPADSVGTPIDVPIETEGSASPPEPAPAPTSSPGSAKEVPTANVGPPEATIASNQAPAPRSQNADASDSDLFV